MRLSLVSLVLCFVAPAEGRASIDACPAQFGKVSSASPAIARPIEYRGLRNEPLEAQIEVLIPKLDALFGGPRPHPVAVRLTDNAFYRDAFFLPKEREVKIGADLHKRSPEAWLGVFAHEYGHAFFRDEFRFLVGGEWLNETAARAYNTKLLADIEALPRFGILEAERQALIDEIPRLRVVGPKDSYDRAVARFHELQAEKTELVKPFAEANAGMNRREKIARAYSELHSDTVAALALRNRGVIAEALGIPPEGPYVKDIPGASLRRNNPGGARPRSFEINRFKEWAAEDRFVNEYAALDPARGVLWELYLKNLPDAEAPRFFRAFLAASEKEVQRLFVAGADESLVSSPKPGDLNRDFLRAFREAAREQGLPIYRDRK